MRPLPQLLTPHALPLIPQKPALNHHALLEGMHASGTSSSHLVAAPLVQRQTSQHLLSASLLSGGRFFCWCIDTDYTFFFKFLKITKLPWYMGCQIIHVPSKAGNTLDLAVFSLNRIWWQPADGSSSAMAQRLTDAFPLKHLWERWHSQGVSAVTPHLEQAWLKTVARKDWPRVSYATLS